MTSLDDVCFVGFSSLWAHWAWTVTPARSLKAGTVLVAGTVREMLPSEGMPWPVASVRFRVSHVRQHSQRTVATFRPGRALCRQRTIERRCPVDDASLGEKRHVQRFSERMKDIDPEVVCTSLRCRLPAAEALSEWAVTGVLLRQVPMTKAFEVSSELEINADAVLVTSQSFFPERDMFPKPPAH